MFRKKLFILIVIASFARLVAAGLLELGNDEVYYYTYALRFQMNYFDHPPGVALLIKLFTLNLHLPQEFFLRLGAVVGAAVGTVLSYSIGKKIRSKRAGWFAAILYNTSIYSCIIAGTFILPDSPQVVFWLASIWLLLKLTESTSGKPSFLYWLLFGVMAGLCIMCKVHGGFLWIGLGLYILLYQRQMLLQPGLYIAAIITALIISPIYFWNAANNFITWRYHSERVEVHQFSLDTDGFIQTVLGQLFYNNPVNVVLILVATWAYRQRSFISKEKYRLLCWCSWPIILFTTLVSLFRTALPHWSGPGFVTLLFVAAAYADDKSWGVTAKSIKRYLKAAVVLISVVLIGGCLFIRFYPGTTGSKEPRTYGEGDFSLDLYGWGSFSEQFISWKTDAEKNGIIAPGTAIVCNKWFPAAHLDYYLARHIDTHVVGVGKLTDLHQYAWLNTWRGGIQASENAICIVPSNNSEDPQQTYGKYFEEVTFLKRFGVKRSGQPVRYFDVYMLKKFRANDELFGKRFD